MRSFHGSGELIKVHCVDMTRWVLWTGELVSRVSLRHDLRTKALNFPANMDERSFNNTLYIYLHHHLLHHSLYCQLHLSDYKTILASFISWNISSYDENMRYEEPNRPPETGNFVTMFIYLSFTTH